MKTYDYIKQEVTPDRLRTMIAAGLVSAKIGTYYRIYEWHINNGQSKKKTAEHFGLKPSTTAFAIHQMSNNI